MFSNAKASVFVIWEIQKVRLHKHNHHRETVYILSGKGEMRLGKQHFTIRKGNVI
ncbi:MAG TPA: DUF861 domain-containing protein [Bacteroidetes bacterium]|nr:DUF861 domain-containing protein [Bacteroidota bacterium]